MNIRQRMILNRWKRRMTDLAPLILGIAIGAAAFAVFDQTYGQHPDRATLTNAKN